ncbi:MAG: hypothetical protein AAGA60_00375 [Cyanobacteria bacterium P01_E01_bin.42]
MNPGDNKDSKPLWSSEPLWSGEPLWSRVLRKFSPDVGLRIVKQTSEQISFEADLEYPFRSIGVYCLALSVVPIHSDLIGEYDFFDHPSMYSFRLFLFIAGIVMLLFIAKAKRCTLDKQMDKFLIETNSILIPSKREYKLSLIKEVEFKEDESDFILFHDSEEVSKFEIVFFLKFKENIRFKFIDRKDRAFDEFQKSLSEFIS